MKKLFGNKMIIFGYQEKILFDNNIDRYFINDLYFVILFNIFFNFFYFFVIYYLKIYKK
jgi:hypothetical protein